MPKNTIFDARWKSTKRDQEISFVYIFGTKLRSALSTLQVVGRTHSIDKKDRY